MRGFPGKRKRRGKRRWEERVIPEFIRETPQRRVRPKWGTNDGLQEKQTAEKIADGEVGRGNRRAQVGNRMGVNAGGRE